MGKNLLLVGVLLLTGVATGRTAVRAAEEPAANDAVFKMEEVSVFDVKEVGPYRLAFVGGQMAVCTPTPNPEVNAYPKLKSKRPLYGFMMVVRSPTSPAGGVKFHFVLDESGEGAPPADKPNESPDTPKGPADTAASKTEAKSPPPSKPSSMDLRSRFGSLGSTTETKYDLLYFDANRDLDLTNDPVVKLMKEPPKGLTVGRNTKVFETINLQFEVPPDPETRRIRVFPTLQAYGPNTAYLRLYPASARRGKIRVGNQEYTAILSYPDGFTGRLDLPQTRLELIPAGEEPARRQLSRDLKWLCAMREVDGVLYRFSATPSGDELRVGPYRGDYGVLEVSAGGKDLRDLGAVGLFVAKERAVTFGAPVLTFPLPEEKSPRHNLPVGDYTPYYFSVRYGRVGVTLRENWYSPEEPGGRRRELAYGIGIRKDRPLVIDFSQRPRVVFTNPPADIPVRPGESVAIKALLIDSSLGLLIAGLQDRTRKVAEERFIGQDGKMSARPVYASLDPDIVIVDSSGKKVAEGKMPFG